MTTAPVQIEVKCPACAKVYDDWYRASVNLDLEGWDANDPEVKEYLRECSTATCPKCGHIVEIDMLIVEGDVWTFGPSEPSVHQ